MAIKDITKSQQSRKKNLKKKTKKGLEKRNKNRSKRTKKSTIHLITYEKWSNNHSR